MKNMSDYIRGILIPKWVKDRFKEIDKNATIIIIEDKTVRSKDYLDTLCYILEN